MNLLPDAQRFNIPDLPTAEEVLPFLRRIDENRWYSNFGPLVGQFESLFAEKMAQAHRTKRRPCVATSSGFAALSVGLRLLGIGPGKRVLVPAVTFPACPLAAQNLRAEVVLGDIDPESWLLTPQTALKIAEQAKIDAVMPVSLYGIPLPASEWDGFHEKTGIPVLIDAAAAVETQLYPKKALVAHSLHALKPFGIGEGGLLMIPDEKRAATAREIINFGMRGRVALGPGENAKMSEYHAAVGLAQLTRWEEVKERRRRAYQAYEKELSDNRLFGILHPKLEEMVVSCLMIRLPDGGATRLMEELNRKGVAAHRTYLPPLYTHPSFSALPVANEKGRALRSRDPAAKAGLMTGAEEMNETVLGLPFHPFLSGEDIARIVGLLVACLEKDREERKAS